MFGQQDDHTTNDQHAPPPTNSNNDDLQPDDILGDQPTPDLSPSAAPDPNLPLVEPDNNDPASMSAVGGVSTPISDTGLDNITAGAVTPDQPGIDRPNSVAPNDLLDLKNQALHELEPLVDHLDQTPEEKFKTTLMLIQASDNQSLIKSAFETAQKISDSKERAQALLDLINEINYFTQINKAA